MKTDRIKPAVSWPGGKSKLLDEILPRIPKHTCYVEPFGGGLAVFLAKEPSQVEVINDLNGELVNFYKQVQFHPAELLAQLEFILNSRQQFEEFRQQPGLTEIQRAARWFFRNKTCFGGASMDSFGTSPTRAISSRSGRMENIRSLNYRLDKVTIENKDWQKIVDLYDRSGTFFFMDPPYTGCNASMYGAWDINDVRRLRDRLSLIKGSWMVTLNDNPDIRKVFSGCKIKAITRQRGINNKGGGTLYKEVIITRGGGR